MEDERNKRYECPSCGGAGECRNWADSLVTCSECNGRGVVEYRPSGVCTECGGKGSINSFTGSGEEKCLYCGGTGKSG